MRSLKKTLVLRVLDREISVDVDFRVIEIVERAFDMSADAVLALFSDTARLQRHKVADVIAGWLTSVNLDLKRREIREAVITASAERFSEYLVLIYGALLFALHYVDEGALDELVSKTKPEADAEAADEAKKKPKASKKASSRPATG